MDRKLSLPLTLTEARLPTVDVVRKRLGGRASTEGGAGELVTMITERGLERLGVVLFVRGEEIDVWTDGGVVRRARREALRPAESFGLVPEDGAERRLLAVARDAQSFAALTEGQRVHYQHERGIGEATLVEKCRFGGLVERSDGAVLAIGFRRLWAAKEPARN